MYTSHKLRRVDGLLESTSHNAYFHAVRTRFLNSGATARFCTTIGDRASLTSLFPLVKDIVDVCTQASF